MYAKIFTIALAAATVAGLGTASAQQMRMERSMDRSMSGGTMQRSGSGMMQQDTTMQRSGGRMMREPSTTGTTMRGASQFAPGQMKKQGNNPRQSAREFAPGNAGTNYAPPGQRMNRSR